MTALIFAGIASYQMMAGLHRAENFLIGEGLGLIVWNAMVPIGVCAVFLIDVYKRQPSVHVLPLKVTVRLESIGLNVSVTITAVASFAGTFPSF